MTKINDGGPAFPFAATDHSNVHLQASGMSLRDYVAVQAMTAFYSRFDARNVKIYRMDLDRDAVLFFDIADAMLAARSGGQDDA